MDMSDQSDSATGNHWYPWKSQDDIKDWLARWTARAAAEKTQLTTWESPEPYQPTAEDLAARDHANLLLSRNDMKSNAYLTATDSTRPSSYNPIVPAPALSHSQPQQYSDAQDDPQLPELSGVDEQSAHPAHTDRKYLYDTLPSCTHPTQPAHIPKLTADEMQTASREWLIHIHEQFVDFMLLSAVNAKLGGQGRRPDPSALPTDDLRAIVDLFQDTSDGMTSQEKQRRIQNRRRLGAKRAKREQEKLEQGQAEICSRGLRP